MNIDEIEQKIIESIDQFIVGGGKIVSGIFGVDTVLSEQLGYAATSPESPCSCALGAYAIRSKLPVSSARGVIGPVSESLGITKDQAWWIVRGFDNDNPDHSDKNLEPEFFELGKRLRMKYIEGD